MKIPSGLGGRSQELGGAGTRVKRQVLEWAGSHMSQVTRSKSPSLPTERNDDTHLVNLTDNCKAQM